VQHARSTRRPAPLGLAALAVAGIVAPSLCAGSVAEATAKPTVGPAVKARRHLRAHAHRGHRKARKHRHRSRSRRTGYRRQRSGTQVRIAPGRPVAERSDPNAPIVDAGFEEGLLNWNIAGVGEVVPTVVAGNARSGEYAGRVVLAGNQNRSELGLGGDGTREPGGLEFFEGDEYWYGFSFNIQRMVYGHPGAHNLIMQFHQQGEGSPNFGLQLWDYEGDDGEYRDNPRGLWSHAGAMGGDRFLAPVAEHEWHDVAIHFRASNRGDGFYELYLDGRLIDARSGISMIMPGFESAYIKTGLYRNGDTAPGTSELLIDSAKLGKTAASVRPG
jgi:Polysaccharide lyase